MSLRVNWHGQESARNMIEHGKVRHGIFKFDDEDEKAMSGSEGTDEEAPVPITLGSTTTSLLPPKLGFGIPSEKKGTFTVVPFTGSEMPRMNQVIQTSVTRPARFSATSSPTKLPTSGTS